MAENFRLARLTLNLLSWFPSVNPEWQEKKIRDVARLRQLKRRLDTTTQHELDKIHVTLGERLERVKEKEAGVTRDYREFLDSIDEMKKELIERFSGMPKPMAFVIHNHMRSLVDELWQVEDINAQRRAEGKLAELTMAIFDDTTQLMVDAEEEKKIPAKTLEIVQKCK